MVEVIRTKAIKKARKEHKCSYCGRDIKIGDPYRRSLLKIDEPYTWNECKFCEVVAGEITSSGFFVSDGDGFSREDFSEAVQELHGAFCKPLDFFSLPRYTEDLFREFCDKELQRVKETNQTHREYTCWKLVERRLFQ